MRLRTIAATVVGSGLGALATMIAVGNSMSENPSEWHDLVDELSGEADFDVQGGTPDDLQTFEEMLDEIEEQAEGQTEGDHIVGARSPGAESERDMDDVIGADGSLAE